MERIAAVEMVELDEIWSSRVAGGLPVIDAGPIERMPASLRPGACVALTDPSGGRLAFAIHDPDNGVLRVLPAQEGEELDLAYFTRRVEAALSLRARLDMPGEQSAYRLVNAEGDGLSGFLVDVHARHAVIYSYAAYFDAYVELLAEAVEAVTGAESIIDKVRPAGGAPSGRVEFRQRRGSAPPRQLQVVEHGVRYEVHLLGGVNTGLFCDMRDARRAFGRLVRGARVLNLFCYTGAFSVVGALQGAESVTSVDFAGGVLHWAETNFHLNGLAPRQQRYKFVRADALDFLKTERRKGHEYDAVVVDPPATTSVPGRRWHLKSDYDRLIARALKVTAPGGLLVVAASSFQSRPEKVESQIRAAGKETGRRLRLLESFGLPADFPTQMIYPQSRYLKCYFLLAE